MKPIIIGELNPYGADPYYALYPSPSGCTGHRLCHLILGMEPDDYLEAFDRMNLCDYRWSIKDARKRASLIEATSRRMVLLGAKVTSAFGFSFKPFEFVRDEFLILPHPSGLCRLWQEPGAFRRARKAVEAFVPDVFAATPTTEN